MNHKALDLRITNFNGGMQASKIRLRLKGSDIKRGLCVKVMKLGKKYKIAKKNTKKTVSDARVKTFDGLYQSLSTKIEERNIYKLAKSKKKKTQDVDQVKCIKDKEGKLLVTEQDIRER